MGCGKNGCYDDCEDCERERKWEEQRAEERAECPHRKECRWVATDVKHDRCKTCGKTYTYS